jgi:hypothetical protein
MFVLFQHIHQHGNTCRIGCWWTDQWIQNIVVVVAIIVVQKDQIPRKDHQLCLGMHETCRFHLMNSVNGTKAVGRQWHDINGLSRNAIG